MQAEGNNQQSTSSDSDNQWRLVLKEIVKKIRQPSKSELSLPLFSPDRAGQNARVQYTTADLCLQEKPVNWNALIIVLNKTMQGSASLCDKSKDNESYSIYVSKILTAFMTRWQTYDRKKICV